jgi:hypothetical protein
MMVHKPDCPYNVKETCMCNVVDFELDSICKWTRLVVCFHMCLASYKLEKGYCHSVLTSFSASLTWSCKELCALLYCYQRLLIAAFGENKVLLAGILNIVDTGVW